jgi:hypothetical protein
MALTGNDNACANGGVGGRNSTGEHMSELKKKPPLPHGLSAQETIRKAARSATIMALEEETKKREKDFRQLLKKAGYNLKKTPANHWTREHYGVGYLVTDDRNVVVCGAAQREYDATLLQVACFMEGLGLQPSV